MSGKWSAYTSHCAVLGVPSFGPSSGSASKYSYSSTSTRKREDVPGVATATGSGNLASADHVTRSPATPTSGSRTRS